MARAEFGLFASLAESSSSESGTAAGNGLVLHSAAFGLFAGGNAGSGEALLDGSSLLSTTGMLCSILQRALLFLGEWLRFAESLRYSRVQCRGGYMSQIVRAC